MLFFWTLYPKNTEFFLFFFIIVSTKQFNNSFNINYNKKCWTPSWATHQQNRMKKGNWKFSIAITEINYFLKSK